MRQDGRSVDQRTLDDIQRRRDRERKKACVKYGEAGQTAAGDLGRDAFDYAVNELVGLLRYAEMLEARLRSYDLPVALRDEALSVCRRITASASRHMWDLAEIRLRLIQRGIALGKPEAA
jgi:hypothetical protein